MVTILLCSILFHTGCISATITTFQSTDTGWFSFDMKEAVRDTRGRVSLFCAEPPLSVETDRDNISCVFSLGGKFIMVSQRVLR